MKYITTIGAREFNLEILDDTHVVLDGKTYEVNFDSIEDQPVFSLLVDGRSFEAYVYPMEGSWQVVMQGQNFPVLVEDEREKRLRSSMYGGATHSADFHLKAPMPGLVVAVPVADRQPIEKGEVLIILESMKMQNELKSPRSGFVSKIKVQVGDSVEQHQTLLSVVEE